MRAGELRYRASVLELTPEIRPLDLGRRWIGIRGREAGDVQAATGLRARAMVEVRARFTSALRPGRYLCHGKRLLVITSVRDFRGDQAELILSCEELVGEPAEFRPADGPPVPCRVFITHSAPVFDDEQRVTDYRTLAELALIEVGRCQVDDQLQVAGQLYNMIDYAGSSDDGVVRGMYLEAVT